MDDTVKNGYKNFLMSPAGEDLVKRLISTEAKYQMEGMKAAGLEEKGLAMAKIEAIYEIRTMVQDLSKPVPSQSLSSAGSKQSLTKAKR